MVYFSIWFPSGTVYWHQLCWSHSLVSVSTLITGVHSLMNCHDFRSEWRSTVLAKIRLWSTAPGSLSVPISTNSHRAHVSPSLLYLLMYISYLYCVSINIVSFVVSNILIEFVKIGIVLFTLSSLVGERTWSVPAGVSHLLIIIPQNDLWWFHIIVIGVFGGDSVCAFRCACVLWVVGLFLVAGLDGLRVLNGCVVRFHEIHKISWCRIQFLELFIHFIELPIHLHG